MWLHSLKVAQLLRSAACLHTNQSRSYLNHLVHCGFPSPQQGTTDVKLPDKRNTSPLSRILLPPTTFIWALKSVRSCNGVFQPIASLIVMRRAPRRRYSWLIFTFVPARQSVSRTKLRRCLTFLQQENTNDQLSAKAHD